MRLGFVMAAAFLSLPRAAGGQGVLARCHYGEKPDASWTLQPALGEISGLALAGPDVILAHDDERGRIYRLDPAAGRIVSTWPLAGLPTDDYEGIAVAGARIFLATSDARLYQMALPTTAGTLTYTVVETGFGAECEFEGLAWDDAGAVLLLPCKALKQQPPSTGLRIYRWDPARKAPAGHLDIARAALRHRTPWDRFEPSAIEVDPRSGNLLLLSSRQRGLLELERTGAVIGARRLHARHHRQPEGLTLTPSGDLLISDEAAGGRATLSRYACRP